MPGAKRWWMVLGWAAAAASAGSLTSLRRIGDRGVRGVRAFLRRHEYRRRLVLGQQHQQSTRRRRDDALVHPRDGHRPSHESGHRRCGRPQPLLRGDQQRRRLVLGCELGRPARRRHVHHADLGGGGERARERRGRRHGRDYHTCALTSAGAVLCWGNNSNGQLGDGTSTSHNTPTPVSGLGGDVVAIDAEVPFTCAVTSGGAVFCWGYNFYGQLGDGTTTLRYTPTAVSGLSSGVADVDAGAYHACAATSGGAAWCWGGTTSVRLATARLPRRSRLLSPSAAGQRRRPACCRLLPHLRRHERGCGLLLGFNSDGEVGDGTTAEYRSNPGGGQRSWQRRHVHRGGRVPHAAVGTGAPSGRGAPTASENSPTARQSGGRCRQS